MYALVNFHLSLARRQHRWLDDRIAPETVGPALEFGNTDTFI